MPSAANAPFNSDDPQERARFRRAVAGALRNLLSGIHGVWPNEIPSDVRQAWWPGELTPARRSPDLLLSTASGQLQRLGEEFGGYLSSMPSLPPIEDVEDTTQLTNDVIVEFLRELSPDVVDPEKLGRLIQKLKRGKSPRYVADLMNWDTLRRVRQLLDRLSDPAASPRRPDLSLLQVRPPNLILWNGAEISCSSGNTFKLLRFLISADDYGVAEVTDVEEAVWGDKAEKGSQKKLSQLLYRIRKMFEEKEIPYTIREIRAGYVQLLRLPEDPDLAEPGG